MQNIISFVLLVMGSGGSTWFITEFCKLLPNVPINEGQTGKIRALAAALSAIATVLMAFADKNIQPTDLQHLLITLVAFSSTWGVSHGIHKLLKLKDGN